MQNFKRSHLDLNPALVSPVSFDLVARLMAHEESAFEELVRSHGGRMLAVATRYLPCQADAEDAVQDAFVNVVRSIEGFKRTSSLGTWLHRIVVNCALMRLRTRRRRPEVALDLAAADGMHLVRGSRGVALSPYDAMELAEAQRAVRRSIDRLPEEQRAVLLLRDVDALDLASISEVLDVGLSTVKLRLSHARRTLHRSLSPSR